MGSDLPKSYAPAEWEDRIRARWDEAKAFHADPLKSQAAGLTPFSIVIPPPNVTAALHLGHAFNNTLQDILTRYHRMLAGPASTLWMPGTDHAGIATQTVVEKRLLMQGKKRRDFSREEFVAKVQEWKDEYEATILDQLKTMGASCDFDRTRFTMDDICAKAVREAFFRLFKDGLIYRGKRLVNWDPASQTALADDEVEMEDVQGFMYYLRYPIIDDVTTPHIPHAPHAADARGLQSVGVRTAAFITVATTRPETMLGDVAVAMNPKDPRAAHYVGKHVRLPIVDRVIPIIADDYVVRPVEFGGDENDGKAKIATGFLKVTPAHDDNDYAIGQRHNLPIINVFAPDASISDKHGWTDVSEESRQFLGLSREEAREAVVKWFEDHGLLEGRKPYSHSVGHSYRSHVPIEPYLSDQWYVKVTDDRLRGEALRAMAQREDGGPGVSPGRVTNVHKRQISKPITENFSTHGRNLPHWQAGGSTYFITFRAVTELTPAERKIVADALLHWHGQRAQVHLATVMPDHAHWLITPMQKSDGTWHTLPELLHSVKGFASKEILKQRGSSGAIWQDEYLDRIMRDEEEFLEKWNYIWNNPLKAGLVEAAEEYPFTVQPLEDATERRSHAPDTDDVAAHSSVETRPGETPGPPNAGDGTLTFYPARYAKTFQSWHENIRDWCISRQIWWGHRIPVWSGWASMPGDEAWINGAHEATFPEDAEKIRAGGPIEWGTSDNPAQAWHTWSRAIRDDASGRWYVWSCVAPGRNDVERELESWGYSQDPDVLDTWFSSALWPISTMGWPDPEAFPAEIPEGGTLLNTFNPSTVLCTAREIITLWVSRMVMFNRYLRGGLLPFRDVYIHAMIQDGHGQKMSKSLGNGVDPRDIIHSHGADALRFIMTSIATQTQDVRLPVDMVCPAPHCNETFHPKEITSPAGYRVADAIQTCPKCQKKMVSGYGAATGIATPTDEMPQARNTSSKFDEGRNLATKLWNVVANFALPNLRTDAQPSDAHGLQSVGVIDVKSLSLIDRWIISRLHRTLHVIEDAIAEYRFKEYADAMYEFVRRDFCDWYVEAIKPTIKTDANQQQVLRTVLNAMLRLLHPIMPFVTEALWTKVRAAGDAGLDGIALPASDLLATAAWPDIACRVDDDSAIAAFERVQNLVNAIRNIRSERQVPPKKRIALVVSPETFSLIVQARSVVEALAVVDRIESSAAAARPAAAIPLAFEGGEILLHGLVDAIDVEAERQRLTKLIIEKDKAVAGFKGRLSNEGYLSKAPPEKVEETRQMLAQAEADLEAARKAVESLKTGNAG